MTLNVLKRPLFVLALACIALVASVACAEAEAPAGQQQASTEGPGGRIQLRSWTVSRDREDRGSALGWMRGGFAGSTVSVPGVLDPHDYKGAAGTHNYDGTIAWFRTSFQAPQRGVYAVDFESANFSASVWVDGHPEITHRGSYLPFEVRRTLAPGTHTLVVRVDWRNPAQATREGFHRTWFNWGGLNGPVYVRPVGESELSEPTMSTSLTPDTPGSALASVTVSVTVHNYGPSRTLTPEGSLVRASQTVPLHFAPVALGHDRSARVSAQASVPAPALWSPSSPALYQLSLQLGAESSYSARVGLRELSWHGGRLYLNGAHLYLHGASIQEDALGHGDALTAADQDTLVAELKAIGANAARSQHPLDPGLLERLDAAGILVWQGVGPVEGASNWYSNTPTLLAQAESQARTGVLAAELHPSIFAWNLVDEVAKNGNDSDEVHYVRSLSRWLHAYDPTRMVAVDVWGDHPPRQAGSLYSEADAVAETDYSGWYDSPSDTPAQLAAQMRSRLAAMERTFAGKVLVISEFGAESNTLNPAGSPGSYSYQSRLLGAHIHIYASDPRVSAMFAWVLRDYPLVPTFEGGSIHRDIPALKLIEGLNQKGLFTYSGQAKPAASTVASLYRALPEG